MKNHHPARSVQRAGFTLLELLAAMVILAILTGMATPRMHGILTRNRLDQAANQLVGDVAYARMVAIRTGKRVTVEFSSVGYRIAQAEVAAPTKEVNLGREHPGMALTVGQGMGHEPALLTFDSRGLLRQGEGLRVVLRRDGQTAVLDVSSTGKVQRAR